MAQSPDPQQPFIVPGGPPQFTPPPPPARSSNRTLWIVLTVVAVVVLMSCLGIAGFVGYTVQRQIAQTTEDFDNIIQDASDLDEFDSDFPAPTASPLNTSAAVGLHQMVEAGDLDVTITNVRFDPGSSGAQPAPGNQFVVLTMEVTNRSRRSLSPDNEFYLSTWIQDTQNNVYECCNYDLEDTSALYGPIASGDTDTVTVVYEAPQASGDLYWVYEEYYDDRRVAVKIR